MSVVPKVWKRLMLTFLSSFIANVAYNIVVVLIFAVGAMFLILIHNQNFLAPLLNVYWILYLVGLLYMAIVWQLADVVTVLEDTSGFEALRKSRALLKGKIWVANFTLLLLFLYIYAIQISFQMLVANDGSVLGAASRVAYGIICSVLLSTYFLFEIVSQAVIYLVCKSYHHENIDKLVLSDQLAGYYIGEYVPFNKDRCDQFEP